MVDLKARPFYLNEEKEARVRDTLASRTDEEKLGQLFCMMGAAVAALPTLAIAWVYDKRLRKNRPAA